MPTEPNPLAIELRDIASIKPYERNPRLNEKAIDPVAASLKAFGFRQPIVVDADSVIIAGHTRFFAAQKLGLAKVPVHRRASSTRRGNGEPSLHRRHDQSRSIHRIPCG